MNLEELKELNLIKECEFKTSRSGGAGGQNVNKVETKVELRFPILNSNRLTDEQKVLLLKKLHNKLDKDNNLHIKEQSDRTQLKNKELLIEKFYHLITEALKVNKARKTTKLSKAVKAKRLDNKKIKSETKQLRKKIM